MYFSLVGLKGCIRKKRHLVLFRGRQILLGYTYQKQLSLLNFLEFDLKKNILPLFCREVYLQIIKGRGGVKIGLIFGFFRNNVRAVVYIRRQGYLLLFLTGGHVAKKVLSASRVYKRDKKGDGALTFIGKNVKRIVRLVLKFFKVVGLILLLRTYFKRFYFFKLIVPYVFKRLRRKVLLCIPRGHNSMESAKRWRRRRR